MAQVRVFQVRMAAVTMCRIRQILKSLILVLACASVFGESAWAQFETRAKQTLGNNEFAIAAGDFNGDGKEDIVTGGNEIFVLLGNGDGTFQKPTGYLVPGDSIAVADFNRDGKPDLVVTNLATNSVSVLLGNGDGTFQSPLISTITDYPTFLAVGDFNNDGKLDLVVVDSPYISVLLGNGDGTFQQPIDNNSFVGGHQLAVGDFNNDHKLDVVVVGYFGANSDMGVLLGNGDGTLKPSITSPLAFLPESVAAGRLSHSGNLDVAVGSYFTGAVTVFLGKGDGSFQSGTTYAAPVGGPIIFADFNGDGNLDMLLGAGPPAGVDEFLGKGDGTFSPPQFYGSGRGGYPVPARFTRSTAPGLALLDTILGLTTLVNTGTLNFSPSAPITFPVQLINTVSRSQTLTLTNTGTTAISISSLTWDGSFRVVSTCGNAIAAGDSCNLTVTFEPKTAGVLQGTITLHASESLQPQVVLLSGLSTAMQLSPSELNFGDQKVGTTSVPQQVTVTNFSGSAIALKEIGIGAIGQKTGFKDFHETNTCGTQIAAGSSCTISVIFAPISRGGLGATVFVDVVGGANPAPVVLFGTGT